MPDFFLNVLDQLTNLKLHMYIVKGMDIIIP